ncbi:MAG TPA: hypothetical protein VFN91_00945 [Myxococcaceae bacterium]|nr:hypothetical protein [Myxococcaceae bacterium]
MTREPETPEDVRQAADLAESDRAESADGLPLPPPDDPETRLARDTGKPAEAAEVREGEEQGVAEQIAAERGAD